MIDGSNFRLDIYNGSPHRVGVLVHSDHNIILNSSLVYRLNYGYEGCEVEITDPEVAILEGYVTRIYLVYGDASEVVHYGIVKSVLVRYTGANLAHTVTIQITTAGALMEEQDMHQATNQLMQPWTDPSVNPNSLFPQEPDTLVFESFNHQNILKLQTESDGTHDTANATSTNTNNLATSMTNYSRKIGKGWTVKDDGVLSFVTLEPITAPAQRVVNNQDIVLGLEYGMQSERQRNTATRQGWRAGTVGNITTNTQATLSPASTTTIYGFTYTASARKTLNGFVFMVDDSNPGATFQLVFKINGVVEFEQTIDLNNNADTEQLWIDDDADGVPDRFYRKVILDRVILLQNGSTYTVEARNDLVAPQLVPSGVYYLLTNMGYGTKVLSNDFIDQADIDTENLPQDFYRVELRATEHTRYDLGNRVMLTGLNIPDYWDTNLVCTKIQLNPSNLTYTYTFGSDDDTLREIIKKIAQKANS